MIITTNNPNKRNIDDVKRLNKWVGLLSLSPAVHMLGGWPIPVSNLTPAVNFLRAVFSARNSRVVENLRAGMSPGDILRELL